MTIATPHEKSPAATQPAIARFYERTNRAWVDANNADVTSRVAMVSVGGGDADRQVRPARAKPPTAWTHGMIGFGEKKNPFNVTHAVAGSIPGATGVSADHRCVVWCQQIVVPIAETLLDVASDPRQRRRGRSRRSRADATRTDVDEDQTKNQTPEKPKTTRLDAAAALALDRSPSLVPIMLALAIDALVVPQTTRRGGFGVEGATVRGATSLFAAPVFVRSRVVLVFVLGGFIGGGIPDGGGTHGVRGWALGVPLGVLRGVLSVPANLAQAFAAYAFAASALTLEALALDCRRSNVGENIRKTGWGPDRRTTRRKVGDVTTVVDVSRRGFHVPFIATATAAAASIWCPGAGVAARAGWRGSSRRFGPRPSGWA